MIDNCFFTVAPHHEGKRIAKFENVMTSSLDDVIKIAKMTKILYILDDAIALK